MILTELTFNFTSTLLWIGNDFEICLGCHGKMHCWVQDWWIRKYPQCDMDIRKCPITCISKWIFNIKTSSGRSIISNIFIRNLIRKSATEIWKMIDTDYVIPEERWFLCFILFNVMKPPCSQRKILLLSIFGNFPNFDIRYSRTSYIQFDIGYLRMSLPSMYDKVLHSCEFRYWTFANIRCQDEEIIENRI